MQDKNTYQLKGNHCKDNVSSSKLHHGQYRCCKSKVVKKRQCVNGFK